MDARFFNISPDGAQIKYSKDVADKLFNRSISVQEARSLTFGLKFSLPVGGSDRAIDIAAKPVYQHRLDSGEYTMGLLFDDANEVMKERINSYLFYHLEPGVEELRRQFPLEKFSVAAPRAAARPAATGDAARADSRGEDASVPESQGPAGGTADPGQALLYIMGTLREIREDIARIRQRLDKLDGKS